MISGLTNINMLCGRTPLKVKKSVLKFCSENINKTDTFERVNLKKINLKLRGQVTDTVCSSTVEADLSKPQKFKLYSGSNEGSNISLIADYDPKRTGELVDKYTGENIPVSILKVSECSYPEHTAYHFMSKDLSYEYGHVELEKGSCLKQKDLMKDYPKQGIVGDRVIVSWLQNKDNDRIGGVGKLADKMAVSYCVENGIPLNIVSYSGSNSHLAHFRRGKRFIPPEKNTYNYKFLKNIYGCTDPNAVLKNLSDTSDRLNQKMDLSYWDTFVMYLPKEIAEKYKRELLSK